MKRFCVERVLPLLFIFAFLSCDKDQGSKCKLDLNFSSEYSFLAMKELRQTLLLKGVTGGIPDTNDFILSIVDGAGKSVYHGAYKEKPEEFILDEGGYTVSVISWEQKEPLFNMPQYGDSHVVFLQKDDNVSVSFLCKHINAGIKINYSTDFKRKFPSQAPFLKIGDYVLEYPYSEARIAYFFPARVELLIRIDNKEEVLFSKDIAPGRVQTINMTASTQYGSQGLNITLDTSKTWITEDITWGENNNGNIEGEALTITEAKRWIGAKEVWIKGYIVGGDLSTSKIKFEIPFTSETNFAISDNKNETNRDNCMSVELRSGKVRDALNLVIHPSNLKKLVFVKGEIVEKYFGLVGVKGVKDFRLN